MKKRVYLMMAAPVLLMASCSQDEAPQLPANSNEIEVVAEVEGADALSRAVDDTWEAGDAIGVSMISRGSGVAPVTADHVNKRYNISSSTISGVADFSAATEDDKIYFDDNSLWTFAAYCPYQTIATSVIKTSTGPTEYDIIEARGATAQHVAGATDKPKVMFTGDNQFKHVMSKVIIRLVKGTGVTTADMSNYKVELNGLKHDGSYSIPSNINEGKTVQLSSNAAVNSAWVISGTGAPSTLSLGGVQNVSGVGELRQITPMYLIPQTVASFTMKITNGTNATAANNETFTCTIGTNYVLEAGKCYTINVTVNETDIQVTTCTIADWTPVTLSPSAY